MSENYASTHTLLPHPATSAPSGLSVHASCFRPETDLFGIAFELAGPVDLIALPARAAPERQDGLWTATCVELFLSPARSGGYHEINLSPASCWAVYRFDGYRSGHSVVRDAKPAAFDRTVTPDHLTLSGTFRIPELAAVTAFRIGLSAVMALKDGTKSYWALAHPPGAPDFHHQLAFTATL